MTEPRHISPRRSYVHDGGAERVIVSPSRRTTGWDTVGHTRVVDDSYHTNTSNYVEVVDAPRTSNVVYSTGHHSNAVDRFSHALKERIVVGGESHHTTGHKYRLASPRRSYATRERSRSNSGDRNVRYVTRDAGYRH